MDVVLGDSWISSVKSLSVEYVFENPNVGVRFQLKRGFI